MTEYRFYLFGAPRLEYQDQLVTIDTRKALALLAYLLIENQPQSRESLATLLWPESDQASARAALRRTLSPLRKALHDDLVQFGREVISVQQGDRLWCDVTVFNDELSECREHGHPENQVCISCLDPLQGVADLYQDDFMAGFGLRDSAAFDEWQFFEADRLRRTLAGVLERLAVILHEQENFPAAIEYTRRWLSLDTLNEAAQRALITLYALNGQRNAALRQYRECVRILDQELGVPPLEETTQLYEKVKENRLESSVVSTQFSLVRKPAVAKTGPLSIVPSSLDIKTSALIGRSREWQEMNRHYNEIEKNGILLALTGEAGIGKTHLAEEFIQQRQNPETVILKTRGYAGESNLAFAPLVDLLRQGIRRSDQRTWWEGLHPHWLSEVSLLIPELSTLIPDLPPSKPSDGPGAQSRFYEGICQVLTALVKGSAPGVIIIDNLEWVDESTLDLLAYLIRRLERRAILLLLAWREEKSPVIARLEQMLVDAVSQGYGIHLSIKALPPEDSLELIKLFEPTENPFPASFKTRLVEESEGLPYFLVEYLQAVLDQEIPVMGGDQPLPVPSGLRGMLGSRLARLSGSASQILQAAAIIGRTFDSDLLGTISGRTEDEIIQGLEELLARKLIREVPVQSEREGSSVHFDFRHDTQRGLVQEEISVIRRRLLHRRTAEALTEQARFTPERLLSGQIAYHYQQAGFSELAASYYFKAGQAARRMNANTDALVHFQAAISLGFSEKQEVLVELGNLYALQGDYMRSIQQYEAAASFNDTALLPHIEKKIGQIYLRLGYWEQAACHFEAALYDLEDLDPDQKNSFEAQVRSDWSLACHRNRQNEKAKELARQALHLSEGTRDVLALAQTYNMLGILARAEGQPGLAIQHLTESLALTKKLEDPAIQIGVLNNLALAYRDKNAYPQAIEMINQALAVCIPFGDRHLEAAIRNNYADLLRASGDKDAAMTELKLAIAIFAEIGQRTDDWEPEIWKLFEW